MFEFLYHSFFPFPLGLKLCIYKKEGKGSSKNMYKGPMNKAKGG